MSKVRRQYPFHLIEQKWQQNWAKQETFRAWNPGDNIPQDHPFLSRHPQCAKASLDNLPPKYYILDMFPYPSGAGLHVGHPEGYTATDILARFKRALGFHVLHPFGWDAFGLPAEQYAIKTGQHPRKTTQANIATFKRQTQSLGFSYDWSREVDTTDPEYFRWTQWIFLKIYNSWFNPITNKAEPIETLTYPPELVTEEQKKQYADNKRLAFVSEAPVNWCPELGTVLANEEVIDGKSEVGGFPVIRRPMRQWMLRITAYAERLLQDLDLIDWSASLKEMQRNWIGRSEGADVLFTIEPALGAAITKPLDLTVFTTRPDTLFGATYMVLSPEHKWVDDLMPSQWPENTPENWKGTDPAAMNSPRAAIVSYRAAAASKSDLERTELAKEKTGVFTGAYAINPVNGERIPIWIADYVLASYGTGAIMAVPAHDTRDLEFAKKFQLPIRIVVQAPGNQESIGFVDDGTSINSGFLTGLPTPEAKAKIASWLEAEKRGRKMVNYKLRDWLFSRQRYWGEPFPIIWKNGNHYAVSEADLPLVPPPLTDYKPTSSGEPPLSRATDWVNLLDGSVREVNTMPQWAGSCWYYLRYMDARNPNNFCQPENEKYWMGSTASSQDGKAKKATSGVDLYVGGTEHAVLHLLYSRFWHKILFDLGFVSTPEPFYKLVNQGLILGEDGQKMSKSRGNVINPDDILVDYGADAFRLYEMFMGPLEMVKPWSTQGVEGVYRFLGRVWRLFVDEKSEQEFEQASTVEAEQSPALLSHLRLHPSIKDVPATPAQLKVLHACIKKVTEDLHEMRFNTAISALMVFINEAMGWEIKPASVLQQFLVMLQPFSPHLAEELNVLLIKPVQSCTTLAYAIWPEYNLNLLVESTIELPIQVNGRLRDTIVVPVDATPAQIEALALASEKVKTFIVGKTIKKVIIVPKKVINIAIAG